MVKTTARTKPLPVRIDAQQVARLDALRGYVPRETYVRLLLDEILTSKERQAKTSRRKRNAAD